MPKLIKIETPAAVSNFTPPEDHATLFYAEEGGKIVPKAKTSAGAVETVGGDATVADTLYLSLIS